MSIIGKFLIFVGLFITFLGTVFVIFPRIKIPFLGRLPGDILIQKNNFTFYFPIASCLLISLVLSLFFYLFFKR
ncbi:MAG TPA: DUF2905 domain-containing protein [Candidatus Omnitrophica bacterium]|nr:DUF2905 domain-containing protein [Candidatus Omnitrophota bacterium]